MRLLVLFLPGAAVAAPARMSPRRFGEATNCTITNLQGAAVDLSVLASAGTTEQLDYMVASEQFNKYEYVFNVCRKLAYEDDVCLEDSTVCDRNAEKLETVTVYGGLDDFMLGFQPYRKNETSADTLTLEYTAGECFYRPAQKITSRIFFLCDSEAYTPVISLKSEDYLECLVEFNFATTVACGTEKLKYACEADGACRPYFSGTQTYAECKANPTCAGPAPPGPTPPPPPPPPAPVVRYGCNPGIEPGVCYESESGEYPDEATCNDDCKFVPHMYTCSGDTGCILDAKGTYRSEAECLVACRAPGPPGPLPPPPPPPPPPADEKYRCVEHKCEVFAGGVSKELCDTACAPTKGLPRRLISQDPGFMCVGGEVLRVPHGGTSRSNATAACGPARWTV